jgi:hypothetical protein
MVPCPRCGQAVDPTKAVYSKQGELICKSCETSDIVVEGYVRAARSTCYGALATGIVSVFFNPFYILSIVAVVASIRSFMLINRQEYKSIIGSQYGILTAAALVGLLTGLVHPGMLALSLIAAAFI